MLRMKQKEIPIFFTMDDRYAPYLDCAIRSIVQNASRAHTYKLIVLFQELSEENKQKIRSGVEAPFQIEFVQMRKGLEQITDRAENRLRCDYFTMTIYFRLFIAEMFPQYEKGIYLDSDIVVPGDISELFQIDLQGNIIGACRDHSVAAIPELLRYMEYAVGVDPKKYINSGVLLMDLKQMRAVKFSEHFLSLLATYHFDCIAPDQDYINAICNGKILYLDECWDTMPPEGGVRELLENPKLIHYNLFQKPWCYDNIPYEEYFWSYAKKSPFYQQIVREKEGYSEAQKESDRECLRVLVEKSGVVDRQEVTFRKVREGGERIRL